MKKNIPVLILISIIAVSCSKKTDKERAIDLVKSKYDSTNQRLNFVNAQLDSLFNISPKAYADSIKRGNELDLELTNLETLIEHLDQKESDSVGKISAKLTKERYRLLKVVKIKPIFKGWKLIHIKYEDEPSKVLTFNFDKAISKIVE